MDGLQNRSFGPGYWNLSQLHTLMLSGRCNIQWLIKDTFRNVIHLRKLNVSSCNVTTIEADALTPLKNLTMLDISKNRALKLGGLENITYGLKDTTIRKLFVNEIMNIRTICNIIQAKHIRNLQNTSILEIHANGNGLSGFSEKTFEVLPPSLKRAYLLFNRFSSGPYIYDLQHLLGLEVLILNGKPDSSRIIPYGTFLPRRAIHMNYKLRVPNMNNIQVKCANTSDGIDNHEDEFLQTLSSGLHRFRTSHKHPFPVPPHLRKFEYTYSELSAFLFFMTLVVILSAIAYRYRWKLSYWYFATRLRFKVDKTNEPEYDYDAFVSFAEEDRTFVFEELIPSLETEKGLHLNIHSRDFLPGRPIAESIIDVIQRSRKTVLVLTPEFLKSTWCRYELQMANMESVTTDRDILLILVIKHIPKCDIPPEIFYHLHNNTYLEYPDDGQTDLFWTTLSHSIKTT
ncbi:toll-like receptor 4 [Haliotis rubra]|uniref:toll-like receptor 4 n=1 Tax=Haliotis rubra TaxID=36100 RepID=UPI001EE5904C|nr:toll-like receptor 4 [Haliotis rubra]